MKYIIGVDFNIFNQMAILCDETGKIVGRVNRQHPIRE